MPTVDIVIPCYNYARFLKQSVSSALSQENVDVRVLIIDDCSSDDSEETGLLLEAKDNRVTFRRHQKNQGHIATYNEGLLEWATADYSLLLSADDLLAPGALSRATQVMERHREVGMTCGMGRNIWEDETCPLTTEPPSFEYQIVSSSSFLQRCFSMGNAVCTPTAVVRTELQHRLGGYRADLPHSGDMEMWMRFAVHAQVGVLRSVQAYYRKHSSNMSAHYVSQLLGDQREVLQACEQIFAQWGSHYPDSFQWRELMLKRISVDCCWLASCAFEKGDTEGYQTCINFAEQLYPGIRWSRMWWKTRAKRFIGQRFWRLVLPKWKQCREFRKALSGRLPVSQATSDQLTGWWPDPIVASGHHKTAGLASHITTST